MQRLAYHPCPRCHGSGYRADNRELCYTCDGDGGETRCEECGKTEDDCECETEEKEATDEP